MESQCGETKHSAMRSAVAVLLLLQLGGTIPPTSGTNNSVEQCICPELETTYTCTCTTPQGYITSSSFVNENQLEYLVDPGFPALVLFSFAASDLLLDPSTSTSTTITAKDLLYSFSIDSTSESSTSELPSTSTTTMPTPAPPCTMTIGDHYYASWGGEEVKDSNLADTDTNTPVTILRNDLACSYNIYYVTYKLETLIITLNNTNGNITAPSDPTGLLNYRPNSRYLYLINAAVLNPAQSSVKVDFTLHHLDLGGPDTSLNSGFRPKNYTAGDFLLIGTGENVLAGGVEAMYYGQGEAAMGGAGRVTVVGEQAHVLFYASSNIYNNATGFYITYNTSDRMTTPAPPTTTPQLPTLPHTYVAINGIPVEQWANATSRVQATLAQMSTDYLQNYHNPPYLPTITSAEIVIVDTSTCDPFRCLLNTCVAYDFGVGVWDEEGKGVLSEEDLHNMLQEPKLQHYVTQIGQGCEICQEEGGLRRWLYVGVIVGVVLFGLLVTLVVWKYSTKDTASEAMQRYEQDRREKMEDQKRRSTGDISMLGLGYKGSVASRGTLASRRFTMPFPKPGREDDSDEDMDNSGFREYDPDIGMVHPSQFGFQKTTLPSSALVGGLGQHTNQAFVEEEMVMAREVKWANLSDTDTDDSDGEGAVSFSKGGKSRSAKRTHFLVPADIHNGGDIGETAL